MYYFAHTHGQLYIHHYISPLCPPAMPREVTKAKIACLDFSLQKAKMKLGVQLVIDDPEKLDAIRQRYVCVCVCVWVHTYRSWIPQVKIQE